MEFVWAAGAASVTALLIAALRDALRAPALLRTNYAGRDIVTGAGIVAIFGALVVASAYADARFAVAWLVAFAAVGFFDDVVGTHGDRGLRGHARALRRRRLTSGLVKLVVGVAVAAIYASAIGADGTDGLLVAILVAGSANAGNQFDLAPGRACKVAFIAFAPLLVLARGGLDVFAGEILFFGAVLGILPFEMRERVMLGDAGANAIGAAIGMAWALHLTGDTNALAIAAIVVVVVNLAGELFSFSRVIARVPPLRMLDQLGRRR